MFRYAWVHVAMILIIYGTLYKSSLTQKHAQVSMYIWPPHNPTPMISDI